MLEPGAGHWGVSIGSKTVVYYEVRRCVIPEDYYPKRYWVIDDNLPLSWFRPLNSEVISESKRVAILEFVRHELRRLGDDVRQDRSKGRWARTWVSGRNCS